MTHQEKRQARIDRLRFRAVTARTSSAAHHAQVDKMLSVIPLGQPILVDHYSATRDRNYRARAWSKMDKAVAEADTRRPDRGQATQRRLNAAPLFRVDAMHRTWYNTIER